MYYNEDVLMILTVLMGVAVAITVLKLILQGIPLCKMAKKANIDNAWLAFLPIGNLYIMMNIPSKEFNLFNIYKTKDRKKAFAFYILTSVVIGVVSGTLGAIPCLGMIIALVGFAFSLALGYKIYSDLFSTFYDQEGTIVLLSILSMVVPIIFIGFLYAMSKKPRIDIENKIDFDSNQNNYYM